MSDRPPTDGSSRRLPAGRREPRFIAPSPSAHVPADEAVAVSARKVLLSILRPTPRRDLRAPHRVIRGGSAHRALRAFVAIAVIAGMTGCGRRGAAEFGADVDIGAPPPTRTDDVVDVMHGVEVPDPYRWLEDQESPETRAWIDAQNAYTDGIFAELPGRERLTGLVTELLKVDQMGAPRRRGDRYFFMKRGADEDLSVIYTRDGAAGEDRVVIDPHGMSEDHTTSAFPVDISDDGQLMVYSVRQGGVDETEVRIRNVDTGEDLPDVLPANRYGSGTLTPDKTGMFYGIYGTQEPRIYYHRLGTDPSDDPEIFGEGYTMQDIPQFQLSDDGKKMLITVSEGSSGPTRLLLADVREGGTLGDIETVIDDGVSRTFGDFAGDKLLLTTDLDAPNSRVVVADLDDPSVDHWEELVPESEGRVIQGASAIAGHYFVSYLEDVQPQVAQYDTDGNLVRRIEFDTLGSTFVVDGDWDGEEAYVGFSSFHVPTTTYRLDVDSGEREVWFRSEIPIDTDAMEVEQVSYESKDGTRVPMFIVHRKGLEMDGTNQTYLTGYGGFNISRTPGFSALAAAWVELGGVFAVPNLRGGGELGEAWHRAGMFGNKQNVFDDFIAAAEYLIDEGYTSPEHLAIAGGSNGGLLVGAAMTQRPDLFGAVVCSYPLLDMLRYHRFMVARFWVPEYGSAEDPDQFEYLRAYSPYQNVEEGTEYPATLFITGDGDTRVAPLHARKMAALVQAANGGDEPILLRYHTKAGHSGGQPVSEQIGEMVDELSFLLWRVGSD